MNSTTKAFTKNAILNFGFTQGMVLSAILLIMIVGLAGCQTTSPMMADDQSDTTLDASLDSGESSSLDATDSVENATDIDHSELIFTEGLGYQISWPLEERFIITPPQNLRKVMLKTCQDSGYITPYINTIEFENNGIKAYFLCRGFGG